jgi:hypothetical protein
VKISNKSNFVEAIKLKIVRIASQNPGLLVFLKIWMGLNCFLGVFAGVGLGSVFTVALYGQYATKMGSTLYIVCGVIVTLLLAAALGVGMTLASLEIGLPVSALVLLIGKMRRKSDE